MSALYLYTDVLHIRTISKENPLGLLLHNNYLVSIFSLRRVNNFDEGVKELPDS